MIKKVLNTLFGMIKANEDVISARLDEIKDEANKLDIENVARQI